MSKVQSVSGFSKWMNSNAGWAVSCISLSVAFTVGINLFYKFVG